MSLKLLANPNDPPIGALIVAELIVAEKKLNIQVSLSDIPKSSGNVQLIATDGSVICETSNEVGRYLARTVEIELYGGNDMYERTEVDHWLSFSIGPLKSQKSMNDALDYLENILKLKTWLVAKRLTLADIYVFSALVDHRPPETEGKNCNVNRWYKQMLALPAVQKTLALIPKTRVAGSGKATKSAGRQEDTGAKRPCGTGNRKQEGKFIELPGAEKGKVVVRFPPEASGYLHIGHAKAALLNQYYAEAFDGQLIMRFDDTNPAKENVEFEQAILQDLEMLQIKPDRFTHSSDYFDLMLTYCDKLIKDGKAFVDDTPALTMKEQREKRLPSANRDNSVEKNMELWEEMQKGTARGQECCVRAKIDYQSTNGCMRDPTIYRCKPEPHPRTGTKYKVYPTYDFACPIVDAVEGVTHTLRTTEYHDRDVQFYWLIEALDLRRPYIWEYSRLNMTNTVLSKRRLTWLVAEGLVDGWDDPRFPTVRGILRRGMTVDGLKQFIIAQGGSRSVVFMEWDKIWSFNKKVIDPIAIRYTALNDGETVVVNVENAEEGFLNVQNHPKDVTKGMKKVRVGPRVLIERCDAETLVEGQNATFINWGNLLIVKVNRANGVITGVDARLNLDNKDFKNTVKLTWLAVNNDKGQDKGILPCYAVYFEHIISKAVLGKDEDFKDFVAKDTRREVKMLGESEMERLKEGDVIQLQRKGFFRCDVPYAKFSPLSSREQPVILFHIPDGHATAQAAPTNTAVTDSVAKTNKEDNDGKDLLSLHEKITVQGNKVREVKTAKADKTAIDAEVKILLSLKAEYKTIAGEDWKPDVKPEKAADKAATSAPVDDAQALSNKIQQQGEKIGQLKADKVDKKKIDREVKTLLSLKAEYKKTTGKDWKPNEVLQTNAQAPQVDAQALSNKIQQQGDKVRQLKTDKADKQVIDQEVKNLLAAKAEYKSATGKDWKPNEVPQTTAQAPQVDAQALSNKIQQQGDKVRQLKTDKADKQVIDQEVKNLLAAKAEYKSATGKDWKPNEVPQTTAQAPQVDAQALSNKIQQQGDKVRQLKTDKADKQVIDQEVKNLLAAKAEYKSATGKDWKPNEVPQTTAQAPQVDAQALSNKIQQQGDKVRQLKTDKADKQVIDQEVKNLLTAKAEYKSATGKDWKPNEVPQTTAQAPQVDAQALSNKIQQQGDKVRQLKTDKADKQVIDQEVKNLLAAKAEYKSATGKDWKPNEVPQSTAQAPQVDAQALSDKIQQQGDKIRQLKTAKADKQVIDQEIKNLLAAKAEYKSATGTDWKPSADLKPVDSTKMSMELAAAISAQIAAQNDAVNQLKSQKAPKTKIDVEVNHLLRLKSDYQRLTGQDWKSSNDASASVPTSTEQLTNGNELSNEIIKQGDKVRQLKNDKAKKNIIDEAVKTLLDYKNKYKTATGQDWKPPGGADSGAARKSKNPAPAKPAEKSGKKEKMAKDQQIKDADSNKTGTRLGLEAKKSENLSDWYSQVITKGEMIEYYDVSGCYILRPWSFSIWDIIKDYVDREIKKLGVQNCYFPIFVSKAVLEREKDHIADFAPEVAWVTKSGESDLAEPIAIRPTSETVMYPAYAKWLKSYRDLPLKLNQWNNVVRWEFKHPQPFLRTREFLWQEGHSAFATKPEADEEVLTILEIYAKVYEEFLAVPVVRGRKTEKEKFAGGDYTTTVEAFVSASGRAIQGATSHHLGQNFSKMFDIQVEGAEDGGEKTFVYQNSWGMTTRTIGVMIMVHGDDKGLVLPPKVAAVQAIIVPCGITATTTADQRKHLMDECAKLEAELKTNDVLKVRGDYRDNYSPGWKFNHWELKGVPVRVELGFKDLEKKQVTLVRRDTAERVVADRSDVLTSVIKLLDEIQNSLLKKATAELENHIKQTNEWKTFCTELDKKNLILAPFCGEMSCEDNIKADSTREDTGDEPGAPSMGAKGLCIPFEQPKQSLTSLKCVHPSCKNKPKFYTLFGRSY